MAASTDTLTAVTLALALLAACAVDDSGPVAADAGDALEVDQGGEPACWYCGETGELELCPPRDTSLELWLDDPDGWVRVCLVGERAYRCGDGDPGVCE